MDQETLNREKLQKLGVALRPKSDPKQFYQGVLLRKNELLQKKALWARNWIYQPVFSPNQMAAVLTILISIGAVSFLWLSHQLNDIANFTMKKTEKIVILPVVFSYKSVKPVTVEVVGDFNGWQRGVTILRHFADGEYRLELQLPAGSYQYQFVVNGNLWQSDPNCSQSIDDGFGSKNSLLVL